MGKNQRLALIATLCAQAVVISLFERQLPTFLFFAPGAKMGLANIITCIALFTLPIKDTVRIVTVRLLLTAFLSGTMSTLLYGASGAFLSLIFMILLYKFGGDKVSIIGISVVGGFMHNLGQLLVASLITRTWTVLLYLPILSLAGIIAGILIGFLANYLLEHIEKLNL